MAVKDIFDTDLPAKITAKPELAKDINAVVHFKITGEGGGDWTLDATKTEGWITPGINGESKMTVYADAPTFEKVVKKQLNAQMAVMSGKVKIKPMSDMGLVMKVGKLIG